MSGRAYFLTGTDTGVGKTWVSVQLLREWRVRGLRVAGLKAAESGCSRREDQLRGADDEALFEAAGGWQPERCRNLFEHAIAPGVAADDAGTSIDFEEIAGQASRLIEAADRVIVEGAGGWLVPMGGTKTIETLAMRLGLEVIVVARAGLGTINHTGLTVRAIAAAGLRTAAVLMSLRPDDDRVFAERNAAEISRLITVPVVIVGSAASAIDTLGL